MLKRLNGALAQYMKRQVKAFLKEKPYNVYNEQKQKKSYKKYRGQGNQEIMPGSCTRKLR